MTQRGGFIGGSTNDVLNTVMKVLGIIVVIFIIYYLFFSSDATSHVTMLDAREMERIPANQLPMQTTSNTYSLWFYINDWNYNYGRNKILFKRFSNDDEPAPSIFLDKFDNTLKVQMAYFVAYGDSNRDIKDAYTRNHTCRVRNIPLQRWVHLLVSNRGRNMDIYLDGKLVRTCILPGVPVTSTSDGFIAGDEKREENGGFNGLISEVRSFNRPLTPREAFNEYRRGSGNIFSMFNRFRLRFSLMDRNTEVKTFVL